MDDLILNFYACTYWASETASARGQLCIGRNGLYFFGAAQPGMAPEETLPGRVSLYVAYKDVLSLELVHAKRVLNPDSIQVGVKNKVVPFFTHHSTILLSTFLEKKSFVSFVHYVMLP